MTTKKAKYGSHKDAVIQCADGTRTMHEVAALAGVDYDQARSTLRRLGLMHLVITTPQKIAKQAAEIERLRAAVNAEREANAKMCDTIAGNTADFDRQTRRGAGMCAAAIRRGADT